MPRCRVDQERSRTFQLLLKKLGRKYPRAASDLAEVFEEIGEDYEHAAHANAIPGFENRVWKYRCGSSDMRTGRSGGFRVIAWYESGVLYPLIVFAKKQQADVPRQTIADALEEIRNATKESAPE